jgi:hypothetical protein
MIPGKTNRFQVVPRPRKARSRASAPSCAVPTTRQMLFNVKPSSPGPSTTQHMAELKAKGQTGLLPNTAAVSN